MTIKLIKAKKNKATGANHFFSANSCNRLGVAEMPPKTRVSSRLANKKRKAVEVDDLSEEDRPKKKQKIENKRVKKTSRTKNKTAKITKKKSLPPKSSSEDEISDQEPKKLAKKPPKKQRIKKTTTSKKRIAESESSVETESSSSEEISDSLSAEIKRKKPFRGRVRAVAKISARNRPKVVASHGIPKNNTNVKPSEEHNKPNPAEMKAAALRKLTMAKEAAKYHHRLEDEEYTLPDELILQIFSNLRRRDLYGVGLTCRQWLRLSNDQSLGWHSAYSAVLLENFSALFELEGMCA